ncbi:hypothetical protein ABH940_001624 [Streptacidiphilus sp. BW17]|uniref:hypothetical protein n=1 Tax=Streptacidiphilus sp. BW17 TaxID=3156274 RepID=UPI003518890A
MMRTPGQETAAGGRSSGRTDDAALQRPARALRPTAEPTGEQRAMLELQQLAGNAAAARVRLGRGAAAAAPAPAPAPQDAVPAPAVPAPATQDAAAPALTLPPYLLNLQAAGLSTAYALAGHQGLGDQMRELVGGSEDIAAITGDLAGRPETFYGRGRTFTVKGGRGRFDVTLRISRAPADRRPLFPPLGSPKTGAVAAGDKTKMDAQHNTQGTVSSTTAGTSQYGGTVSGTGLAPTPVPGLHAGVAFTVGASAGSAAETRTTRTAAEPRVLRSDGGSVEVQRQIRYELRVQRIDGVTGAAPVTRWRGGTLTMRLPFEHLVPVGTAAPTALTRVDPAAARGVRLADSMAPLAVTDTGATHAGGRGLFDTVGSVLHPSLTAPGAPGRARLLEATHATSVLEDLPRLLSGWISGEDLTDRGGRARGSYRMRGEITAMAPAWSSGKTQLRTHQVAQHGTTSTAGTGFGGTLGVGPAFGAGTLGTGPRARIGLLPVVDARSLRLTSTDQTVNTRQGAEVQGEKALYRTTVRLTVQGTGPLSPAQRRSGAARTASHDIDVLLSLRADEAAALGLPLPAGVTAKQMFERPREMGPDGEREVERHLPFGAMGSSTALSQLDTGPLLAGVERLFATDPRLAGYLPDFGANGGGADGGGAARRKEPGTEEAERQRANHRELLTVLSETNLRANKDQLLSSGVRVRLRRKTALHSHDVQIRVVGALTGINYLGDTDNWLVRSSAGVTSSAQSGRASSRSAGLRGLFQLRILPGALSFSVTGDGVLQSTRRNQAGPTTRTDSLNNGDKKTSAFAARLTFGLDVTMTNRQRTAGRAVTPGSPGRDEPEVEQIASSVGGLSDHEALRLTDQDVRLTTPTGFTLDADQKRQLDFGTGLRLARRDRAVPVAGINELSAAGWPGGGRAVRDWVFVETLGGGEQIRELALQLLGEAAGRNRQGREDRALGAEGLAPRSAIEDRFSPQAVTAALRQGVSSSWVVKNLRYPRRLAALNGAVGTRFALTSPRVVHKAKGPGTENLILGGHQVAGQQGGGVTWGIRGNVTGMENGASWRMGESVGGGRSSAHGSSHGLTLAGTVERNAHTAKGTEHYLVQCDLSVLMAAEATSGLGGPSVAAGERTLPGAAAVWLTKEQLRAAGLHDPYEPPAPAAAAAAEAAPAAATPAVDPVAALPRLRQELPLGFGMIEELPDFVPLLGRLRERVHRQDPGLADELFPQHQLSDGNDNIQRLLRVLDRDGSTGLLAGAMDGGVPVELFRGRRTPYRALFRVQRTGPGTPLDVAGDNRTMEYITSAVAQNADAADRSTAWGADFAFAGAGKPHGGNVRSAAGAGSTGATTTSGNRRATVGRAQLGVKTVAEGSAPSVRMRVPIQATLELHAPSGRVAAVPLAGQLVHRILQFDLAALDRLAPVRHGAPGHALRRDTGGGDERQLAAWRSTGARLPLEAQVNGFRGAEQLRDAIGEAIGAAGGSEQFGVGRAGSAAGYVQREAVSTEWLISALPLLAHAGVNLPVNHAPGLEGQDLSCALHARLREGKILGKGDKKAEVMAFEAVAQSALDGMRPSAVDSQAAADHRRAVRGGGGLGLLNDNEFRLNEVTGSAAFAGGGLDTAANASGSMPLHKPKYAPVLVQFDVQFRIAVRVAHRHTARIRSSQAHTAVRDLTLTTPVVVRLPEPEALKLLAVQGAGGITDPHGVFAPAAPAAPAANEDA